MCVCVYVSACVFVFASHSSMTVLWSVLLSLRPCSQTVHLGEERIEGNGAFRCPRTHEGRHARGRGVVRENAFNGSDFSLLFMDWEQSSGLVVVGKRRGAFGRSITGSGQRKASFI